MGVRLYSSQACERSQLETTFRRDLEAIERVDSLHVRSLMAHELIKNYLSKKHFGERDCEETHQRIFADTVYETRLLRQKGLIL